MNTKTYAQLSVMMFLQFFIWGAWFVTLGTHLGHIGFTGSQIGYTYLMNNIAAIVSPFFVGMIADRFFASQKVLGVLHLVGGFLMYLSSDITTVGALIGGLLLYNLSYMPTLALVNAVSFYQMESPDKQFPKVRVWGTIGWIVAGLVITFVLSDLFADVEKSAVPMKMAAIASIVMGLYSFTLPNTPPQNVGKEVTIGEVLGLKALRLLRERNFFIFVLCSLLISIPLAFYYNFTNLFLNELGMTGVAGKQTMGQMSEVIFMVLMPWFFVRLGVKKMLLVGMLAWVVRYALFATGDTGALVWMLYLGILLHGVCYDFFFVTGQIYVDQKAPKDVRASAQGFIALITYGVGIGLGSILSGNIVDAFTSEGVKHWGKIWWVPCAFAAAISLFFTLTFKNTSAEQKA
ncbi:MAG: nucleoside permease [candidate division KSB1 bacterium]|nr:nucleoside permease [candidate division KSB1 bacterium]MDZ7368906.1 nucleoside permease [candidate division KSB1 bacterium]MDZ7406894.1 nucleoside permease [candidate division KSB1 bacterium]